MAKVILYSPITTEFKNTDDTLVYDVYCTLKSKFLSNRREAINDGKANLGELDQAGGTLYVIGHGHAGGKIGVHQHESVGARSLVTQLLSEGLPKTPKSEITIHLLACCSATSVRTCYTLWRKDPYVERFCAAMVQAGCSNFKVVGYVGFMAGSMQYSLDYHTTDANQRNWEGDMGNSAAPLTTTYSVVKGDYNQLDGGKWMQHIDRRLHVCSVSSHYVVRKH